VARDLRHLVAAKRYAATATLSLGRYEAADAILRDAITLAWEQGVEIEKGRLLALLGWLRFDQSTLARDSPEAVREFYRRAAAEADRAGDLFTLISAHKDSAWCALAAGQTATALSEIQQAEAILPPGVHQDLEAGLTLAKAGVCHQKGDESAAELYGKVLGEYARDDRRRLMYKSAVGLGALQWHNGDRSGAEDHWQRALELAAGVSAATRALATVSIELCREAPTVTPR
jgi:tetratricopeptide (TPR) repeat protein